MPGDQSERPGGHLERALQVLAPWERPLCVQDLEARAQRENNQQMLLVIKDYKEMSRRSPSRSTTRLRLV